MDDAMYSFVETSLRRAGETLLHYFRSPDLVIEAKGRGDLVTEADRASERVLITAIQARFPDHGIVSEEAGEHAAGSRYVWLLDPLEATYNFSRGLPMWGINMALSADDSVQIGAFFDPLLDELYYAELSGGAFWNRSPIRASGCRETVNAAIYCSTREAVNRLSGSVRKFRHIGSIGNALAYVAAGHLDGAVEVGGGPWDYAAGELLVREAGGAVSTIAKDGPMVLAASTPELHTVLQQRLSGTPI